MRCPRLAALAAAAALSLGLLACGDNDKKDEPAAKDTTEQTTTEAQNDAAAKAELQAAVGDYNAGYQTFFTALRKTGGDLDRLKASVSDYRDVIYKFDKDIRGIDFADDLVPQVNAILENNLTLIKELDGIGNARSVAQALHLYERFLKVRTPTVKAVNLLIELL